jgi:hypothetical protein
MKRHPKRLSDAKELRDFLVGLLDGGDLQGGAKALRRTADRLRECRGASPCRLPVCPVCKYRPGRAQRVPYWRTASNCPASGSRK